MTVEMAPALRVWFENDTIKIDAKLTDQQQIDKLIKILDAYKSLLPVGVHLQLRS